jgi:hypothetical protein
MLHDFLRKKEIDILFLEKGTHPSIGPLHGYRTYKNVGKSMRGTAFVTRDEMQLTNIAQLPSGRGMAAEFGGSR